MTAVLPVDVVVFDELRGAHVGDLRREVLREVVAEEIEPDRGMRPLDRLSLEPGLELRVGEEIADVSEPERHEGVAHERGILRPRVLGRWCWCRLLRLLRPRAGRQAEEERSR